ncbi:YciI family protein [Cellulomonas sp. KRMCY2]|uniref:YciI family protein n=1 Tax=Cellulomonas sp. KRMCY2 TaxID=1304865 RepID=UPI00045EA9E4|nr:YciI family protein [Cellulomonas sp. KRMCY2]
MTIYAVQYTYDDRTAAREEVRPEHRAYLRELAERGTLLGSGPFTDGEPGALLILTAHDAEAIDGLLAGDPFAREGLIARTVVRPWDIVIGAWARDA